MSTYESRGGWMEQWDSGPPVPSAAETFSSQPESQPDPP